MDIAEAGKRLRQHAFMDDDLNAARMTQGFLGSLRPFGGELNPENFHDVMHCIAVLAEEIDAGGAVSADLMASLWGICHFARAWGIAPEGMLRTNHLISARQVQILSEWVEQISYAVFMLLSGSGKEEAFLGYPIDV